ncbi:TetR family transcriptional regulator [Acrocarpospora corrugata]|uniref:TetR family transcriptional regulator n=1 Tax=Acrocarpospora corrugata TaxID=35763 RepID=A0A5M3VTA5_9ACTN|nr:TetR family transcriptional regulator [Acrocarpospora corrugata]GER99119.1 TetR family transcriptional regulator [Acrocarpospora corrugata]
MITGMDSPMRERLLEAAIELFYAYGLRAVSVDKVIDRASTTKVTFYRHFKSKDDLVVAYLERRAAFERDGIGEAIKQGNGNVDATLRVISEAIGIIACAPGFRGCPFINAAAEYPDPDSPIRKAVDAHRRWNKSTFEQLIVPLGITNSGEVATDLMLIRDGAMVAGYLDQPANVAASFLRGSQAVIGTGNSTRR